MKKRFIAFFLSALMVGSALTVLSSCADKDKPGSSSGSGNGAGGSGATTTGTGEIPPDQLKPGVPDGVRFDEDGERTPITFVVANMNNADNFGLRSVKLDADDVDENNSVDVAVATRNATIEDQLGVEIIVYATDNQSISSSQYYTALSAQSEEFDVLCNIEWVDIDLCLEGFLTDINNITDDSGNKIDYLSPGKPWWPSYYNDAMLLGSSNSRYWLTGDLSMRYTGGLYCLFVNEDLYEKDLLNTKSDLLTQKYGTDTNYGDIYELVTRGDWTLDILSEMAAKAYHDDGDGNADTAEVWGAAIPVWDNMNGMGVSAGVEFSEKTSDGKVNLLFGSGNARLVDFMTKMRTLLNSGYVNNTYGSDYGKALTDLSVSKVCFASALLSYAELYLTDMIPDYYIIPCPKLDFDQKEYRSSVQEGISDYGISALSQNKVAAAATLELMGYYSYKDVRPVYYDQALKHLYTTDEGSAMMIDLMHDTIYSDFVRIWESTNYFSSPNVLGSFLRYNVTASNPSVQLKKNEQGWKDGLEDLLEDIKKFETK